MAAIRSALAMLGRRSCGSSGYSAAASFRPAAPTMPPPLSLRPAGHSLEGCRRFSTGMREPAGKGESGLRMWWQWARDRMENGPLEDRNRLMFVYTVFVLGTPAVVVFKTTSEVLRL